MGSKRTSVYIAAILGCILALGCIFANHPVRPKPILEKLFRSPLPRSLKIIAHRTDGGGLGPAVAMFVIKISRSDFSALLQASGAKRFQRKQFMEVFDNQLSAWLNVDAGIKKPTWEYNVVYRIETALHPPKTDRYRSVPSSVESYLVIDDIGGGQYRVFIHASPFLANKSVY